MQQKLQLTQKKKELVTLHQQLEEATKELEQQPGAAAAIEQAERQEEEPQSVPPSYEQWIYDSVVGVTDNDVKRIREGLSISQIDIGEHFGEVQKFEWTIQGVNYNVTRVVLKHGFMVGKEVVFDEERQEETWKFHGVHCTSTPGALGILKDRNMQEGQYGDCLYARLVQEPQTFNDVVEGVIKPSLTCSKNSSGVIFEIACRAPCRKTESGGVYGDMKIAKAGSIAHYKSGKESRWLIPRTYITMKAIWLMSNSFHNLDDAKQSMKVSL